ncbi:MAG: hypothetical protein H0Z19_07425 [Archaeoglobus sp.]|uniref:hypothetical protein n=1 Tax=Archaeoglobus sp. TaxID=1872626 RepID=UPI001D5B096B|nr:hypothetical protein [Archaeoglobus sp.]MBO8180295.1 hypothetical protein [Archaeoglobus sp.]
MTEVRISGVGKDLGKYTEFEAEHVSMADIHKAMFEHRIKEAKVTIWEGGILIDKGYIELEGYL